MFEGIKALAKGLGTTFKALGEPRDTIQYPEKRREYSPRFRGKHMLAKDADGHELCVGCGLCEAVCPAHAIRVVAAEAPEGKAISWTNRYAVDYEVDLIRCIFCGMCEEACPTNAVRLTPFNELAASDRLDMIADKEELLHPPVRK
ncbi:NuoI/complex I 23 kDa subunit family protein [Sulfobacillus thermosulfidooxidans]|uniref:NADH-quinone oxidoreductase subunit I n=1 Tax=Sulfobacillus thermosulfidooxidans TaxID=28034 RepID=A0A1R0IUH8_SULTH|nr:NADH-quinone oxidoreductase subunit I [Sulfobacillus thermosulfidooxidans]OLZ08682.1 NADH dehydrogenase [Sulfobacillus thermosulfidooxidans]OLZ17305.1 NADH dehydrogenase [Sulfobacillus thermosulfidooxidans]OLZ19378.1 NADH dehydrogenase [Sulfobacillus thermosulfidooxidans]PSR27268.1 MAG: NADH-quinone oxidoreductase subunit I [Sulfobacillus thermosulfidooxidans]